MKIQIFTITGFSVLLVIGIGISNANADSKTTYDDIFEFLKNQETELESKETLDRIEQLKLEKIPLLTEIITQMKIRDSVDPSTYEYQNSKQKIKLLVDQLYQTIPEEDKSTIDITNEDTLEKFIQTMTSWFITSIYAFHLPDWEHMPFAINCHGGPSSWDNDGDITGLSGSNTVVDWFFDYPYPYFDPGFGNCNNYLWDFGYADFYSFDIGQSCRLTDHGIPPQTNNGAQTTCDVTGLGIVTTNGIYNSGTIGIDQISTTYNTNNG